MGTFLLIVILATALSSSAAIESRIVGGAEARPHSFPYQAALFIDELVCGGSLISESYVVTAAHCLQVNPIIDVKLGVHNVSGYSLCQVEQRIHERNFVIHPFFEWTRFGGYNDIGLIKLNEPVQFNDCIQPINLPRVSDKGNKYVGQVATASGWGRTKDKYLGIPDILRYVDLTVIEDNVCESYSDKGSIKPCHMCTSGIGVKGPCFGDSGGPLAIQESDDSKTLIGITSFGYHLCEAQRPVVFVRVTTFIEWIAANSDVKIRP